MLDYTVHVQQIITFVTFLIFYVKNFFYDFALNIVEQQKKKKGKRKESNKLDLKIKKLNYTTGSPFCKISPFIFFALSNWCKVGYVMFVWFFFLVYHYYWVFSN